MSLLSQAQLAQRLLEAALVWPFPVRHVLGIGASLVSLGEGTRTLVHELLTGVGAPVAQVRHVVNGTDSQAEAVGVVPDGEFEGRVDVALLTVACGIRKF